MGMHEDVGMEYALHYGNAKTPLVTVKPDSKYPAMWRIHTPDGTMSDMVNLSRAKDAAASVYTTGLNSQRLNWKRAEAGAVAHP